MTVIFMILSGGRAALGVERWPFCESNLPRSISNVQRSSADGITLLDLNHIFLFVAVISPLLVLGRAWRPGSGFTGWRIAAIAVLFVTGVTWFVNRSLAGYIGGSVWFVVLFLPAVGLKKVTELFDQRRYRAAKNLATAIYPLHPTADLRRQLQVFRLLESQQPNPCAGELPLPSTASRTARPNLLNSAPAVFFLIAANAIVFVIEIVRHGTDNVEVLHRLGAVDLYSVVVGHQVLAIADRAISALRHRPFGIQSVCSLCPRATAGAHHRDIAIRHLLSDLGSWILRRGRHSHHDENRATRRAGRGVRLHHGNCRSLGRISPAPSPVTSFAAATPEYSHDCRDPDRVRLVDSPGQHGRACLRVDHRFLGGPPFGVKGCYLMLNCDGRLAALNFFDRIWVPIGDAYVSDL